MSDTNCPKCGYPLQTDVLSGEMFFFRKVAFVRENGKVTGFRLSGGRVLNLRFERVQ